VRHVEPITNWLAPYKRWPARYARVAFPALEALLEDPDYQWRILVVPDTARTVVGARAAVEDHVTVTPGSFLWGLTGTSTNAAGFGFLIYDQGAGRSLMSSPGRTAHKMKTSKGVDRHMATTEKRSWKRPTPSFTTFGAG
jgi:hypothetical protein